MKTVNYREPTTCAFVLENTVTKVFSNLPAGVEGGNMMIRCEHGNKLEQAEKTVSPATLGSSPGYLRIAVFDRGLKSQGPTSLFVNKGRKCLSRLPFSSDITFAELFNM